MMNNQKMRRFMVDHEELVKTALLTVDPKFRPKKNGKGNEATIDIYIQWLKDLYTKPDDEILEKFGGIKGKVDFNRFEESIKQLMPDASYATRIRCMIEIKEKRFLRAFMLRRLGILTEVTGELESTLAKTKKESMLDPNDSNVYN